MTIQDPLTHTPDAESRLSLLLQDGLTNPIELARTLLQVFYTPIYRLASALFGPADAAAASQAVFVAAVLDAGNFRRSSDLVPWFYHIALDILKAKNLAGSRIPAWLDGWLEVLEANSRLPTLLHFLAGLDPGQIAVLLRLDLDTTRARLAESARRLERSGLVGQNGLDQYEAHRLSFPGDPRSDDERLDDHLEGLLSRALGALYPAPELASSQLELLAGEVSYQAARRGSPRKLAARLRQVALAGALMLSSVLLVMYVVSGQMATALASPPQPTPTLDPVRQITIVPEEAFQWDPAHPGRGLRARRLRDLPSGVFEVALSHTLLPVLHSLAPKLCPAQSTPGPTTWISYS